MSITMYPDVDKKTIFLLFFIVCIVVQETNLRLNQLFTALRLLRLKIFQKYIRREKNNKESLHSHFTFKLQPREKLNLKKKTNA